MCKEDVRLSRALTGRSSVVAAVAGATTLLIGARGQRAGLSFAAASAAPFGSPQGLGIGPVLNGTLVALVTLSDAKSSDYLSADRYGDVLCLPMYAINPQGLDVQLSIVDFFYNQDLESI